MDCKDITQLITDIQTTEVPLASALKNGDVASIESIKDNIDQKIDYFHEMFLPIVDQFFDALEKDPHALTFMQSSPPSNLRLMNNGCRLYYWQYREFLRKFTEFVSRNQHRVTSGSSEFMEWFRSNINSSFLQSYGPDFRTPFEVKSADLPQALLGNFGRNFRGFYWHNGTLKIDQLSGEAFTYMSEGRVDMTKFIGDYLARYLQGGQLHVEEATGEIGENMEGGAVVIDKMTAGSIMCFGRGGAMFVGKYDLTGPALEPARGRICTEMQKGTCVINEVLNSESKNGPAFTIGAKNEATVLVKTQGRHILNRWLSETGKKDMGTILRYDESNDKFHFVNLPDQSLSVRTSQLVDYRQIMVNYLMEKGVFWHDNSALALNYGYLKNGIVVLEDVGNSEKIGYDQKGGVIIFNDPKITYEEACERTASRNERPGGLVLYLRKWEEPVKLGKMVVGKRKKAEFVEIR